MKFNLSIFLFCSALAGCSTNQQVANSESQLGSRTPAQAQADPLGCFAAAQQMAVESVGIAFGQPCQTQYHDYLNYILPAPEELKFNEQGGQYVFIEHNQKREEMSGQGTLMSPSLTLGTDRGGAHYRGIARIEIVVNRDCSFAYLVDNGQRRNTIEKYPRKQ